MRWTPEKFDELRVLAAEGLHVVEIAERLGSTWKSVSSLASIHKIPVDRRGWRSIPEPPSVRVLTAPEELRARWASLIGPMKEALRADIAADG